MTTHLKRLLALLMALLLCAGMASAEDLAPAGDIPVEAVPMEDIPAEAAEPEEAPVIERGEFALPDRAGGIRPARGGTRRGSLGGARPRGSHPRGGSAP